MIAKINMFTLKSSRVIRNDGADRDHEAETITLVLSGDFH